MSVFRRAMKSLLLEGVRGGVRLWWEDDDGWSLALSPTTCTSPLLMNWSRARCIQCRLPCTATATPPIISLLQTSHCKAWSEFWVKVSVELEKKKWVASLSFFGWFLHLRVIPSVHSTKSSSPPSSHSPSIHNFYQQLHRHTIAFPVTFSENLFITIILENLQWLDKWRRQTWNLIVPFKYLKYSSRLMSLL